MSDPNDLSLFLTEAWAHLEEGVAKNSAPARFPTFATVSPEGLPEARTVALRKALRAESVLEVHTDIETPKVKALNNNPHAALHVWIPNAQLQVRLMTRVEILTGDVVRPDWERVPTASRVSYGTLPIPGTPIDHVHAYEKPPNLERFAVLRCHVTAIDLVHLGTPHRRAVFSEDTNWQGTWVAP